MKKLNYYLAGALVVLMATLCSCGDEPEYPDINLPLGTEESISNVITPAEAQKMAIDAFEAYFGEKSTAESRGTRTDVVVLYSTSSRASNDTLAYIVNFGVDGGYSIVSAKREADTRILAVVQEGHIEGLDEITVPPQRAYLESLLCEISNIESLPSSRAEIKPMPEEKVDKVYVGSSDYGSLSGLAWGQDGYFGAYCDNGLCGCFATATAIVMAGFEYPQSMYIDFTNKIKKSVRKTIYPDWTDIKKYTGSSFVTLDKPTAESFDNIGLICRQIGEVAKTEYKNNSSETLTSNALSALKTLFKGKSVKGYYNFDSEKVKDALSEGRVMIAGWRTVDTLTFGHIWIAEQYSSKHYQIKYYTRPGAGFDWSLVSVRDLTEHTMYMNWGWNGSGNGYYSCLKVTSFLPNGTDWRSGYKDLIYVTVK